MLFCIGDGLEEGIFPNTALEAREKGMRRLLLPWVRTFRKKGCSVSLIQDIIFVNESAWN